MEGGEVHRAGVAAGRVVLRGGAAAEDMEVWAVCFARIPMSSLSLHLRG